MRLKITPEHLVRLLKKTKKEVKTDFESVSTNFNKENNETSNSVNTVIESQKKEIELSNENTGLIEPELKPDIAIEKQSIDEGNEKKSWQ